MTESSTPIVRTPLITPTINGGKMVERVQITRYSAGQGHRKRR